MNGFQNKMKSVILKTVLYHVHRCLQNVNKSYNYLDMFGDT